MKSEFTRLEMDFWDMSSLKKTQGLIWKKSNSLKNDKPWP
jgi:hypothetical protein